VRGRLHPTISGDLIPGLAALRLLMPDISLIALSYIRSQRVWVLYNIHSHHPTMTCVICAIILAEGGGGNLDPPLFSAMRAL
jgi:hypothetical protein